MRKAKIKFLIIINLFLSLFFAHNAMSEPRYFPPGAQEIYISNSPNIQSHLLQQIAPIVRHAIQAGYYPGAVILAGRGDQIIYQGIFGNRRILPDIAPMQLNTIFDIASLTKVVATTPAIMQLVEQGKIELDDPVAKYWPAFAKHHKEVITIRQLLTHTSGLPADIPSPLLNQLLQEGGRAKDMMSVEHIWQNEQGALQMVEDLSLTHAPGTTFLYSDVGFLVLGHLVELITGQRLDVYAAQHIFAPLGMQHTFFLPAAHWKEDIAPTQVMHGKLHWGEVHDPTAYQMGGVSGLAGVFSTAPDLARYIKCLLNNGRLTATNQQNDYLLGPLTILKMITPQTPPFMQDVRGLGWDIASSFSNRGALFPKASFGHTGWTGTSILADPQTKLWLIILTSRTHPSPASKNKLVIDRRVIANIVAASILNISIADKKLMNTSASELARAYSNGNS